MVPLVKNLVDKIWTKRPLPSPKYLTVHEIAFAGKSSKAIRLSNVKQ